MSTALSIISQYVATDKEFAALPQRQRDRVYQWGYALADYYAATDKSKMIRYDTMAKSLGYTSRTTVITKIKEWEATHDWRVLIDKRDRNNKQYAHKGARSERFIAWVVNMAEHECRTDKAAADKIHMFFVYGGTLIPGFEDHVPGSIPPGCSKRQLLRIMATHRKEITRARFGTTAVRSLPVLKTRRGLAPGQIYNMDDVYHDHEVMWQGQMVRVVELGLLDVASGCRVHWGHIPRFRRDDDGKRQGLTSKMSLMFLAYVLRYIGIHKHQCIIMMEHGTATLPKNKIDLLQSCLGGIIQIRMGGIKGADQKLLGGYEARGKGNPMSKAYIESSHGPIHNNMGHLPAQVGWTGRNEPAITWGIRKDAEQVAYWQQQLIEKGRTDLAEAIDMPVMRYQDFAEYIITKYALINGRTDHSLEGWEDHTTLEYNIAPGLWVDGASLEQSPEQKAMLGAIIQTRPDMVRERKLSPAEVWESGKADLIRIPLATYVDLIGDDRDVGRTVTVRDGLIRVQDKLINNGAEIIYLAEVHQDGEQTRLLHDSKKYRVVINPYAIHELIILDDAGRILGIAPQYVAIRQDTDDLYKQIGRVESRKARDMARQRARWQEDTQRTAARREHNRSLAEQGGVAPRRPRRTLPPAGNLPDSDYTPAEPLHATVTHHDGLDLPDADTTSYGGF